MLYVLFSMQHVMRFAEMTQDVMISRPTPVSTPNILGLKTGRGNIYREAIKKAKEQGGELKKQQYLNVD